MSKKLTQEEFVAKARAVHGDKYDYSQAVYTGGAFCITIICPTHGAFEQAPASHVVQRSGCPTCSGLNKKGPRLGIDDFIQKARLAHGGKYDYSEAIFSGTKCTIRIICPVHGAFMQGAGEHTAGRGCRECGKDTAAKAPRIKRTTAQFLEAAKAKHGAAYDYSLVAYINSTSEVKIICPVHGVFEQLPYCHLRGAGCQKCTGTKISKANTGFTPEAFVAKCQKSHPTLDFSQTAYAGKRVMVNVTCSQHGEINVLPATLLGGHGCPKCTWAGFAGKATGWTRTRWVARQQGHPAVLYVFKLQGESESFYKAGISYQPKTRAAQLPYNVEVVQLFQSQDAASIYNLERELKARFKHLRYRPQKNFAGQQECYTSPVELLSYLQGACPIE